MDDRKDGPIEALDTSTEAIMRSVKAVQRVHAAHVGHGVFGIRAGDIACACGAQLSLEDEAE